MNQLIEQFEQAVRLHEVRNALPPEGQKGAEFHYQKLKQKLLFRIKIIEKQLKELRKYQRGDYLD